MRRVQSIFNTDNRMNMNKIKHLEDGTDKNYAVNIKQLRAHVYPIISNISMNNNRIAC